MQDNNSQLNAVPRDSALNQIPLHRPDGDNLTLALPKPPECGSVGGRTPLLPQALPSLNRKRSPRYLHLKAKVSL